MEHSYLEFLFRVGRDTLNQWTTYIMLINISEINSKFMSGSGTNEQSSLGVCQSVMLRFVILHKLQQVIIHQFTAMTSRRGRHQCSRYKFRYKLNYLYLKTSAFLFFMIFINITTMLTFLLYAHKWKTPP